MKSTLRLISLTPALLCLLLALPTAAQVNCSENLSKAEQYYREGLLEKIPALLSNCLKNDGILKEDRTRAYTLLLKSYLYSEQYAKADELTVNFLKFNPDYQVREEDPPELSKQLGGYRRFPTWSAGIFIGPNYSILQTQELYGVYNTGSEPVNISTPGIGFQGGLKGSRLIYEYLRFDFEPSYVSRSYNFATDTNPANLLYGYSRILYQETQGYFELPLTLTYTFLDKRRFQFYGRAGTSLAFLLNASSTLERINVETNSVASGPPVPMDNLRRTFNYWLLGGGGITLKLKKGYAFMDVSYKHGLRNNVNVNNRYSDPELIYKYHYVDNDFKLHNLNLSFGYMRSFFNPIKKPESNKPGKPQKIKQEKERKGKKVGKPSKQ